MNIFRRLVHKNSYQYETMLTANMNLESTQLELIKAIRRGYIQFEYLGDKLINLSATPFYKKMWVSKGGVIKLWFEDPGFMSFTYLKINGIDHADTGDCLEFTNEICLAIQNQKKNYVSQRVRKRTHRLKHNHEHEVIMSSGDQEAIKHHLMWRRFRPIF